jgi:primary-amine oxidase
MSAERLQQVKSHLDSDSLPHPFDPLSELEIELAVSIVRKEHSALFFNAVTLWEPRKQEMKAWLQDPANASRPHRVADVVAIGKGSKVYDGIVDLNEGKIIQWELTDGVQPLVRSS